jgi:HAD superfamily hydrolase (TIGR01509 family)
MDGTLIDTRRFHMEAWRRLVESLGLGDEAFQIARRGFGMTNWAIFERWFARGERPPADFDTLSGQKEALFRQLIAGRQKSRPGLRWLLERARCRGLRVGLVTSGPRENVLFLLRQCEVAHLFNALVWGSSAIRSKPHPEPFLVGARRLGLAPAQCVVFEDSVHGFEAARRAGMRLVAIAERPADLIRARLWTPLCYLDFRPIDIASWPV